jgi:single-stranded DNA-specific DHH superfamily exonuclease
MAIADEELADIRTALDNSARPLFFFDDDCDGTTAFVQLYRYKREGKGLPVKANPVLEARYLRKVEEYGPDLIVILDKPLVSEEFLDKVRTPVIWLDHHKPQDSSRWANVKYYNPRIRDDKDNRPTSYWAHQITKGPIWIATVGAIADWHLPSFLDEFKQEFPELLPPTYAKVEDLLYNPESKIGRLARIISFCLKGTVQETMKTVLVLTRIESPYEILDQTTARGKFLYKNYERLAKRYEALLERAKHTSMPGNLLLFTYADDSMSLTSDLSNELLYQFPEHLVMVARRHAGEYKYSLRSAGKYEIPPMLAKALKGVEGYGGGHTYACGAAIKEKDNAKFVRVIRGELRAKR